MTCIYDNEVFAQFKALSVQNIEELEIGETYYSNTYPEKFKLKEIISWVELDRRRGFSSTFASKDENFTWMITEDDRSYSLADRNIGNSYNPWMIFKDQETKDRCREELKVSIEIDTDWYDYYDDYRDTDWNDYDDLDWSQDIQWIDADPETVDVFETMITEPEDVERLSGMTEKEIDFLQENLIRKK